MAEGSFWSWVLLFFMAVAGLIIYAIYLWIVKKLKKYGVL